MRPNRTLPLCGVLRQARFGPAAEWSPQVFGSGLTSVDPGPQFSAPAKHGVSLGFGVSPPIGAQLLGFRHGDSVAETVGRNIVDRIVGTISSCVSWLFPDR